MRFSSPLAYVAAAAALTTWTLTGAAQTRPAGSAATTTAAGQHEEGEHHHPEAAALKNPVKATPESIAAGKAIYDKQCSNCHGEAGKGDGKMAASITTGPKPSDLTDASWKHGSTDGEIYTLIHDGSKGTGMRGYGTRLKTEEIWNVVNYLKTLAPKTPAKR